MTPSLGLGGEGQQVKATVAFETGEQLVNRLIEGGGRQQGAVEIVAAIVIAPFDILPEGQPGAMNVA